MQAHVLAGFRGRLVLSAAVGGAVVATAPAAGQALTALRTTAWWAADGEGRWLPAAATLTGWVLGAWLAALLTTAAASALPGAAGRTARTACLLLTPRALRAALGMSLALGAVAAPAAAAPLPPPSEVPRPASSPAPEEIPSLDWPVDDAPPPSAPAETPAAAPVEPRPVAAPAPPVAPPHRPAVPGSVVVRPGDCLWTLAAAALPPGAGAAAIAGAWPRWYAANARAIGPDPHLLRPGLRLVPPSLDTSAPVPTASEGRAP